MSKQPEPDFFCNLKAWLNANNWAYWAMSIFGVVGIIAVAIYLLRKPKEVPKQ